MPFTSEVQADITSHIAALKAIDLTPANKLKHQKFLALYLVAAAGHDRDANIRLGICAALGIASTLDPHVILSKYFSAEELAPIFNMEARVLNNKLWSCRVNDYSNTTLRSGGTSLSIGSLLFIFGGLLLGSPFLAVAGMACAAIGAMALISILCFDFANYLRETVGNAWANNTNGTIPSAPQPNEFSSIFQGCYQDPELSFLDPAISITLAAQPPVGGATAGVPQSTVGAPGSSSTLTRAYSAPTRPAGTAPIPVPAPAQPQGPGRGFP